MLLYISKVIVIVIILINSSGILFADITSGTNIKIGDYNFVFDKNREIEYRDNYIVKGVLFKDTSFNNDEKKITLKKGSEIGFHKNGKVQYGTLLNGLNIKVGEKEIKLKSGGKIFFNNDIISGGTLLRNTPIKVGTKIRTFKENDQVYFHEENYIYRYKPMNNITFNFRNTDIEFKAGENILFNKRGDIKSGKLLKETSFLLGDKNIKLKPGSYVSLSGIGFLRSYRSLEDKTHKVGDKNIKFKSNTWIGFYPDGEIRYGTLLNDETITIDGVEKKYKSGERNFFKIKKPKNRSHRKSLRNIVFTSNLTSNLYITNWGKSCDKIEKIFDLKSANKAYSYNTLPFYLRDRLDDTLFNEAIIYEKEVKLSFDELTIIRLYDQNTSIRDNNLYLYKNKFFIHEIRFNDERNTNEEDFFKTSSFLTLINEFKAKYGEPKRFGEIGFACGVVEKRNYIWEKGDTIIVIQKIWGHTQYHISFYSKSIYEGLKKDIINKYKNTTLKSNLIYNNDFIEWEKYKIMLNMVGNDIYNIDIDNNNILGLKIGVAIDDIMKSYNIDLNKTPFNNENRSWVLFPHCSVEVENNKITKINPLLFLTNEFTINNKPIYRDMSYDSIKEFFKDFELLIDLPEWSNPYMLYKSGDIDTHIRLSKDKTLYNIDFGSVDYDPEEKKYDHQRTKKLIEKRKRRTDLKKNAGIE